MHLIGELYDYRMSDINPSCLLDLLNPIVLLSQYRRHQELQVFFRLGSNFQNFELPINPLFLLILL